MKKLLVVLALCASAFAQNNQFSGIPQLRPVGATSVAQYQPVITQTCSGVLCVVPSTGTGPIAGIAMQAGATGVTIPIAMSGNFECVFGNQPVQGDVVTAGAGVCTDSGSAVTSTIASTVGVVGAVLSVLDSTHAVIFMPAAGLSGNYIASSTLNNDAGFQTAANVTSTVAASTLSGDVTGTLGATSVSKVNGAIVPVSATLTSTNPSGQIVAQTGTLPNAVSASSVSLTGQTGSISSATLCSTGTCPAGFYMVSVYLEPTTTATLGTVSVTIGFTGSSQVQALVPITALALTAKIPGFSAFPLYSTGATALTYSTTATGITGSPVYTLRIAVTRLW